MNRFIKIKNEEEPLNLINTLNEDHPSFVGKLRILKSAKIHDRRQPTKTNNDTESKKK